MSSPSRRSTKLSAVPKGFGWDALLKLDGDDLEAHYRKTLEELGKTAGMLGVIFPQGARTRSKIRPSFAD